MEQAARLARLTVADEDKDRLAGELSAILGFVEQLDEINTDILERSYVWEDRTPIGTFSSVFTSKIQSSLIALARSGGASIVDRLK